MVSAVGFLPEADGIPGAGAARTGAFLMARIP